jgi:hypothetical protein
MAGDAGVCVRGKKRPVPVVLSAMEFQSCGMSFVFGSLPPLYVYFSHPGMAAVLFAAVLISTNKETIVFDLLVKRIGLETFAKASAGSRKIVILPTNTQDVILFNLEDKIRQDLLDVNIEPVKKDEPKK